MTDLERIAYIEETFGYKLKKVEPEKINQKDFFTVNPFYYSLHDLLDPDFRFKGNRSYCLDDEENVSGLSLDYSPAFLLNIDFLQEFKYFQTLSLRSAGLSDVSFLAQLKGLTSLDLRDNNLSDVSFLAQLKGLTSLDLRDNNLSDVSFLAQLKGLTSLYLSSNKNITDYSFLAQLKGLTSLYLRNNNLSDISFLAQLKGLTSLYLRNNNLSDVSFLAQLKGLTSLDLRDNKNITDYSFLAQLKGLTSLDLRDNNLSDVSFLAQLKGLTSLYLRDNNLSDVSFLAQIKGLTSLDLRDNNLSDVSFLAQIKGLTSLDLRDNNLSDVSFLAQIKGLTSLDLRNNNLSDVSFLAQIKGLTSLDLRDNNLSDVSFLAQLKGLTSLDLRDNNLSDVSFLAQIKGLTSLDLRDNNLSDVSFLAQIKGLTSLDLRNNNLSNVSFLAQLKGLTSLDLRNNNLSDVSFLAQIKGLTSLYLRDNNLSDVSFLAQIKGLTSLDLRNNNLSDVSFLAQLKGLTSLDLSSNQIKILSDWIVNFNMDISYSSSGTGILLGNNPLESPPVEIVKQGKGAVRDWFDAYRKKLNEVKVLLVGQAKAGKTSLMKRLFDNSYDEHESQTDGIIIKPFEFSKLDTFKEQEKLHGIKAYFWDFGGQEIMSSTHQFFMTKRSLYLLVLEARRDEKTEQQVRNWLKRIKAFGGDSQVVVVVNKIDENRAFKLDEYSLQKEHPQIREFCYVSCDTPENIEEVRQALEKNIPQTELFNTEIDERWLLVKEDLQDRTLEFPYLPEREFENICINHGLTSPSEQNSAISFLNDLGIVLHFEKLKLAEFFVLDPYWVTTGVYRIITSDEAGEKNGIVDFEQLRDIINKAPKEKGIDGSGLQRMANYSSGETRYVVDIMEQFKLSFYMENGQKILIPDLLEKNTPAEQSEAFQQASEKLSLIYKYDYLPASALPRLIVEMKDDIEKVWRSGIILHCKSSVSAKAMIVATDNSIRLIVTGEHKEKREYLSVIRFFIENINKDFTVTTDILIPLPDYEKNFVKYDQLLKMEKAGETKYKNWDIEKEFLISDLLEGIATSEEIEEQGRAIGQQNTIENKTINIFLASSSELADGRRNFELFIGRENKEYNKSNTFLHLHIWEDFIDAMSRTRLQDEYNEVVKKCDIFIMLFRTKVGKYTSEEFNAAFGQFKKSGRPKIYTYFNDTNIKTSQLKREDQNSLFDFQDKLNELGHFQTSYENIGELKYHFSMQLRRILPSM